MKIKKEIIYPFFLECCQFTEDSFWESVFENLAYGLTPYGTYIHKNFLSCSYKGKEFSYKIVRKDPKILYDDIYKLFTEKVGILSQKEKQRKKLVFKKLEKTIKNSRQKWSDIRKKNIKDLLIERYVLDIQKQHSLTVRQAKYFLSIITFAIMFKLITSKDIVYENNKIQNIEGITISGGEIILKKSIYSMGEKIDSIDDLSSLVTVEDENEKRMADNWEKYLVQLRKLDASMKVRFE